MATIQRFEDIIAWQRARELTKYVYHLTKKPAFSRDLGLKSQSQRAAVSSMSNQAEGFARGTRFELINYFYIAKGSAAEVQSHLYVALDQQYIDASEFQKGYQLAEEAQRLIQSFVGKVKAGSRGGLQYKSAPQKKDTFFEDFLRKESSVHTSAGVLSRKEAAKRGAIVILDPEGKWKRGEKAA